MSCLKSGNEYSLTSQVNKINHESMAGIDDVVHRQGQMYMHQYLHSMNLYTGINMIC